MDSNAPTELQFSVFVHGIKDGQEHTWTRHKVNADVALDIFKRFTRAVRSDAAEMQLLSWQAFQPRHISVRVCCG